MPTTSFPNSRIPNTTTPLVTPFRIRLSTLRLRPRIIKIIPRNLRTLLSIGLKAPILFLHLHPHLTICVRHHFRPSSGQISHTWTPVRHTLLVHLLLNITTAAQLVPKVVRRLLRMTSCLPPGVELVQGFREPRGSHMAVGALEIAPWVSKSARVAKRRKAPNGGRAQAGRRSYVMRKPLRTNNLCHIFSVLTDRVPQLRFTLCSLTR